jgi:hypothetical protein
MAIRELVSDKSVWVNRNLKKRGFTVQTTEILYAIKYYLGAMVIWYQEFAEP